MMTWFEIYVGVLLIKDSYLNVLYEEENRADYEQEAAGQRTKEALWWQHYWK